MFMRSVKAKRCKIIGDLSDGTVVEVEYKCPYCHFENIQNTMADQSVGMESSREYEFEDECGYCFKKLNVIYEDSMIENPPLVHSTAHSWRVTHNEPNNCIIGASVICPICMSNLLPTFQVPSIEYIRSEITAEPIECPCCHHKFNVVIDPSRER